MTSDPRRGHLAAWAWTTLGVTLGAALPFWPYVHDCGWRLWFYCGAVFTLLVVGLRATRVTWREAVGLAHTLALLVTLWALGLGASIVLPRTGYSKTAAAWTCGAAPAARPTTPAPTVPSPPAVGNPVASPDSGRRAQPAGNQP